MFKITKWHIEVSPGNRLINNLYLILVIAQGQSKEIIRRKLVALRLDDTRKTTKQQNW